MIREGVTSGGGCGERSLEVDEQKEVSVAEDNRRHE